MQAPFSLLSPPSLSVVPVELREAGAEGGGRRWSSCSIHGSKTVSEVEQTKHGTAYDRERSGMGAQEGGAGRFVPG